MSEKKDICRFTIQFNPADPCHRKVIELLNSQGRSKAQFISNAITHYIHCTQTPDNTPTDIDAMIISAVNRYMDRIDIDEMVKQNVEKANKKRAKKGLPPQKVAQNATANLKSIQAANEKEEADRLKKIERTQEQMKASNDYYSSGAANPNSISAKARMVQKYNEKHSK